MWVKPGLSARHWVCMYRMSPTVGPNQDQPSFGQALSNGEDTQILQGFHPGLFHRILVAQNHRLDPLRGFRRFRKAFYSLVNIFVNHALGLSTQGPWNGSPFACLLIWMQCTQDMAFQQIYIYKVRPQCHGCPWFDAIQFCGSHKNAFHRKNISIPSLPVYWYQGSPQ